MKEIPAKQWWAFLIALGVVHLLGMILIDIMEVDAAQYASMSQEMLQSGNYLEVQHREADYLDKPPLLFWVTSFAFKIFGISNFTFRLPSFLFLILGLYSTYQLGRELYSKKVGQLAVLVLYSSQAYFLFTHDVRTDTILANVVIFAVWQLWLFIRDGRLVNMVLGAVGVALAMLEKGPIGLMVPVLALGSQILYTRNFKVIFRWQWLVGLLVIIVMLAPMVYGLYEQFGAKGLEFYFWTQSFGRITGQSRWKDNSTVFYFVHTFLWAFLPWMLIAYFGIFKQLQKLVKLKFRSDNNFEVITLGGFILTFIAMSLSNYKLPHYIFVVFPLAAIITANTIWQIIDSGKAVGFFRVAQPVIAFLLIVAAGLLLFISFGPAPAVVSILTLIGVLLISYFTFFKRTPYNQIVIVSLLGAITVNFALSTYVYPTLLDFQAGSVAGKELKQMTEKPKVYGFYVISHGLDFYSGETAPLLSTEEIASMPGAVVFTKPVGLEKIDSLGVEYKILKTYDEFHVTELTMEFLNPSTREKALTERYLIQLADDK